MEAQTGLQIKRTQNDTDPIGTTLMVVEDGVRRYVADDDIVEIHIATHPAISVTGTPRGDDLGVFYFPTDDMTGLLGTYAFEIEVNDLTSIYTIGKGKILFSSEIS